LVSGDRGGQGVGPSLPNHLYETLHPKTDENVNSSVEVHDLVGKLSTAETLLTEVQRTVPTCPGKHLFVIRERLYAHPVYSQEVKQAR